MRRSLSVNLLPAGRSVPRTLLTAALALAWPLLAQADTRCTGSPCVRKDVEIGPADAGRAMIAVDPANAGRLALSHRVDYETCDTRTMVHWSEDKGTTWQSKCTMWGVWDDEQHLQSSALAFDRHGVLLIVQPLYWAAPGGYLRASRLDPQTQDWDGWYYVASTRYEQGVLLNNRVQVDTSPASPWRGTVYTSFTEDAWDRAQIRVARSENNGRRWQVADATPPAFGDEMLDFSDLAIGRDGSLYLSYLRCVGADRDCHGQPAKLRFVRSVDGGVTWSAPTLLASTRLPPDPLPLQWLAVYGALPGTESPLSFTPVIAIDNTDGPHRDRLYSAMTTYRNERLQVLLATSDDHGATWSEPRTVAAGPRAADQFMPSISVNRDGVVAVTWMDQRRDPERTAFQPMVAFSTDGGATFSAPAVLQREASQPDAIGNLSGIASHAWAGGRLKTAHIGPDAAGGPSLRLSTSKP